MITIKTQNPTFSGARGKVNFSNGVARVESLTTEQKAWFDAHGYIIEGYGEPEDPAVEPEAPEATHSPENPEESKTPEEPEAPAPKKAKGK